jgi:hypothetical protein
MSFVISPPSVRLPHSLQRQESRIVKGAVTVDFTNVFDQVELCLTVFFIPVIANIIAKYTIGETNDCCLHMAIRSNHVPTCNTNAKYEITFLE